MAGVRARRVDVTRNAARDAAYALEKEAPMTALVLRIQDLVTQTTRRLSWLPPAVARLTLGVVFALSGWGKLHGLDQVTQYFTELGIPAPAFQAAFVSGVELVGGLL